MYIGPINTAEGHPARRRDEPFVHGAFHEGLGGGCPVVGLVEAMLAFASTVGRWSTGPPEGSPEAMAMSPPDAGGSSPEAQGQLPEARGSPTAAGDGGAGPARRAA